ncbi:hypothetical protein MIZ01_1508 [Sideroxyarcus emersonii]|uniref:Uncharacterized protein n=1 Tax=Sideroxyarcus emersonii TaxID=2764705 RepID=A0AAN1XA30_9PROT|nr:hypothetical protein [Sideroxyarcus emersonii]BCK87717.1 hypothetical protein MIZ01_1508 [Sideroxyarcus emersonii]
MLKIELTKILAGMAALTLIVIVAPVRADETAMVPAASQTDPELQVTLSDAMPDKNGHAKTPAGVYAVNMSAMSSSNVRPVMRHIVLIKSPARCAGLIAALNRQSNDGWQSERDYMRLSSL